MSNQKKRTLDDEIRDLLETISKMDRSSEQYHDAVKDLNVLYEIRGKSNLNIFGLPKEIIFSGVVSVFEIAFMLNFEKFDVISTRALQRLWKMKYH